ncbi:unnamed protein product [Prorocentrum cordatum]|uniref:Ribosome biogenesis protein NOP53 n=1 Tax=Prorocentrum cordatum TaxID=2364126 RepID=A0ABN9Y357_9DINO|nr:unnamed protein product [Polarella glacialis]
MLSTTATAAKREKGQTCKSKHLHMNAQDRYIRKGVRKGRTLPPFLPAESAVPFLAPPRAAAWSTRCDDKFGLKVMRAKLKREEEEAEEEEEEDSARPRLLGGVQSPISGRTPASRDKQANRENG